MPGSRYVVWDTAQLEAVLQKDPALRNALLAHLAAATAKKLFEVVESKYKPCRSSWPFTCLPLSTYLLPYSSR